MICDNNNKDQTIPPSPSVSHLNNFYRLCLHCPYHCLKYNYDSNPSLLKENCFLPSFFKILKYFHRKYLHECCFRCPHHCQSNNCYPSPSLLENHFRNNLLIIQNTMKNKDENEQYENMGRDIVKILDDMELIRDKELHMLSDERYMEYLQRQHK